METDVAMLAREAGAVVLEETPTAVVLETRSGVVLEVAPDVGGVVEPGRGAALLSEAWPRGVWALRFAGRPVPDAAPMGVRTDPMLTCAMTVLAAAKQARLRADDGVVATTRIRAVDVPAPDATTRSLVVELDVRARAAAVRDEVVDAITAQARARADRDGTTVDVDAEQVLDAVAMDHDLTRTVAAALGLPSVTSPGGARASAYVRDGRRVVAIVLAGSDTGPVAAALRTLA